MADKGPTNVETGPEGASRLAGLWRFRFMMATMTAGGGAALKAATDSWWAAGGGALLGLGVAFVVLVALAVRQQRNRARADLSEERGARQTDAVAARAELATTVAAKDREIAHLKGDRDVRFNQYLEAVEDARALCRREIGKGPKATMPDAIACGHAVLQIAWQYMPEADYPKYRGLVKTAVWATEQTAHYERIGLVSNALDTMWKQRITKETIRGRPNIMPYDYGAQPELTPPWWKP